MLTVIQNLRKLMLPQEKFRFLILTFLVFIGSLLELAGIGSVMPVVACFVNERLFTDNQYLAFYYRFLGSPGMQKTMLITCIGIGCFFLLKNIFLYGIVHLQMKFTYALTERGSDMLFSRYLFAPYSFHLQRSTALSVEIMSSTRYAFADSVIALMFLISESMTSLLLFASVFFVAPLVAAGVAAVVIVISLLIYIPLKRSQLTLGGKVTDLSSAVTASIMQLIEAIKEVKLAGRGKELFLRFRKIQHDVNEVKRRLYTYSQIPRFVLEAIIVSAGMATIVLMLNLGVTPASVALRISFIGLALIRVMPSIGRIHYYLANIKAQEAPMQKIIDDMNVMEQEKFDETLPPLTLKKELFLENLSFGYEGGKSLFRSLTFHIPANTSTALVGPTGCGKTTLIDLIIGLHKPAEGRILSDGRDIRENMPSWRMKIGYVPQMIPIADASVLENVAFGVESSAIDREKVISSLKMAQAYDFVQSLEHGLDTVVGERGIRLSGGQRQRIGIARALYTSPELLVFDEATSALDVKTEAEFVEALSALRGKITMIVAAHRLSTVENCDHTIDFTKFASCGDNADKGRRL